MKMPPFQGLPRAAPDGWYRARFGGGEGVNRQPCRPHQDRAIPRNLRKFIMSAVANAPHRGLSGFFTRSLKDADPEIAASIADELGRQQGKIELIASENIVSRAVLEAQGSILTNKYAEG